MFSSIFVLIFSVILASANCKKYDVNAECIKIYGEDLRTVVLRFRRTPAYLTILQSKIAKLRAHLNDVMLQEYAWYIKHKLGPKIEEKFPKDEPELCTTTTKKPEERRQYNTKKKTTTAKITTTTPSTTTTTEESRSLRVGNDTQLLRRMDDDDNKITTSKHHRHKATQRRRDNEDADDANQQSTGSTLSPVVILDEYKEGGNMTVNDINEARNIGFEVFGDVIHKVISDMGGALQDSQSTKLPAGGGDPEHSTPTKSTHAEKHTVGESEDDETPTKASHKPADNSDTTRQDDTRRRRRLLGHELL